MTEIIPLKRIKLRMLTLSKESSIQEAMKMVSRYLKPGLTNDEKKEVRSLLVREASVFRKRYLETNRDFSRMERKYGEWLDLCIRVPSDLIKVKTPSTSQVSQGRPTLPFEDKGLRAQQRQIHQISEAHTEETIPLVKATIRTLKKRGEHELAHAFTQVMKDPDLPLKISRLLVTTDPKPFTPTEALKLYQDMDLTSRQYLYLREAVKDKGYKNLFPAYGLIEIAKKSSDVGPSSSSSTATTTAELSEINGNTQMSNGTTPEEQLEKSVSLTTPEPAVLSKFSKR